MLLCEKRAVRQAAFGNPLVGQVHRLGSVYCGRADLGLWLTAEGGLQAGYRFDQLVPSALA